jgi:hypothetical protein
VCNSVAYQFSLGLKNRFKFEFQLKFESTQIKPK